MLRAVFFDLDNTLVDRDAAHAAWCKQLVGSASVDDPEELLAQMIRRDASGYGNRQNYFDWVASVLGLTINGEELFCRHQRTIADFVAPMPGARCLLEDVRRSALVAVVTNGSGSTQRAKLIAAGLGDIVDSVVVSGEVGFHKPDRRLFAHALGSQGLHPGEVLFIGDDPVRDVQGARQVGMQTCWLQRDTQFPDDLHPSDHVVRSLFELAGLLRGGLLTDITP